MIAQLVINEHSRRGREAAPLVRTALERADIAFIEPGTADDVGTPVDCLIAAGGDGTLLSAVNAAVTRNLPLGVIPLGTFNELARTLGIPLDIAGAVSVIAARASRAIDVGRVNGVHFVNEASLGISSRITLLQTPTLKQRFGIFGVVATAFQAFRHSRPLHAEIHYDGRIDRVRSIQLTIANSHRFGGFLQVSDAAIDDGWLDLYSVDIRGAFEAFQIARAIFSGVRRPVPGLRVLRSTRFELRTRHPHHITADGEPAGVTPAVFDLLRLALRVYCPRGLNDPVVSPEENRR